MPTHDDATYAQRLLAGILERHHWTYAELGAQIQCSPRTVGRWVRGEREPRVGLLPALRLLLADEGAPGDVAEQVRAVLGSLEQAVQDGTLTVGEAAALIRALAEAQVALVGVVQDGRRVA